MKKTLKAVIAMVLVLSLGFMMLSTTAFAAASAADDIVAPQAAGIGGFFKALFKKISTSIKSFFSKLTSSKDPSEEETTVPATDTDSDVLGGAPGIVIDDEVVIDDSQDTGKDVGKGAQYAGGIW